MTNPNNTEIVQAVPVGEPVVITENVLVNMAREGASPESIQTLADTMMKTMDWQKKSEFNTDLNGAMSRMPSVRRGKAKQAGQMSLSYAKLEDIQDITTKILAEHNISLRFKLGSEGGKTTAQPIFSHTNGYFEEGGILEVPNDTSGSKSAAQSVGSSATYAMRYALCAALNIRLIDFDDDGKGGAGDAKLEPLTKEQNELLDVANGVVANGKDAYDAFFASLTRDERSFLGTTCRKKDGSGMMKNGKPVSYDEALIYKATTADAKGNDNAS